MMATYAARDQNLNVYCDESRADGRTDGSKAKKKPGGIPGRKALNVMSSSGKPSALQSSRKQNSSNVLSTGEDFGPSKREENLFKSSEKFQTGVREPVVDEGLETRSEAKRRVSVIDNEIYFENIAEEGFLHDHQECIKAQGKIFDMDYFLELVGLVDDKSVPSPARATESPMSPVEELPDWPISPIEELPDWPISPIEESPQWPSSRSNSPEWLLSENSLPDSSAIWLSQYWEPDFILKSP